MYTTHVHRHIYTHIHMQAEAADRHTNAPTLCVSDVSLQQGDRKERTTVRLIISETGGN